MSSQQWERRREEAMERADYRCENCGAEKHFQIHHLSYAHLGDEQPAELAALCSVCHERAHEN